MGHLIVFTGLDGSGTSTVAEALASTDPSGILMQTPDGVHRQYKRFFDTMLRKESTAAHYHYYLSAVIAASERINTLLQRHNVYCVRYLVDTIVSHRVAGLNVELDYELGHINIVRPDLTLFVSIDENIRQTRISERGKSELDRVLDDEPIRIAFLREFERLRAEYFVVDNTKDIKHCVDQANALIQELIPRFVKRN